MNPGDLEPLLRGYGYAPKIHWLGYSIFVQSRHDAVAKELVCRALELAGIRAEIGQPQYPLERNSPLCLIVHHRTR